MANVGSTSLGTTSMMTQVRLAILLLASITSFVPTAIFADITLPQMFSDNMVLQRNNKTKIFGTADIKQKLSVQFGETVLNVTADGDGAWSVMMPIGEAGGPFELTVTAEAGQPQVKLSNVMVGEVWVCAGESNMHWPVSKVLNSKREIEQSINFPHIRFFTVEENVSRQPLDRFEKVVGWDVCSPDTVGDFSATAYFYARELSKQLPGVPIGLMHASWDGTSCEAWISRPGLDKVNRFETMLEQWDSVSTEDDRNRPSVLFNGMISPIKPFPFRGVIWYQGERNNGRGQQYSALLPTLIADWRDYFRNEEMPFYFVQLAPFRYKQLPEAGLAEVWDAQFKTMQQVKHTGMVVTTDIGNADDINPKNKQEVGRRLSLIAVGNVYQKSLKSGEPIEFSGPIYDGLSKNGNRIRLIFKHAQGLKVRTDGEALNCFTICGEDGEFFPATAKIVGESIELHSDEVASPTAVRFGWMDTASPNLVNGAGLPASPFRTDDFPLQSTGKEF